MENQRVEKNGMPLAPQNEKQREQWIQDQPQPDQQKMMQPNDMNQSMQQQMQMNPNTDINARHQHQMQQYTPNSGQHQQIMGGQQNNQSLTPYQPNVNQGPESQQQQMMGINQANQNMGYSGAGLQQNQATNNPTPHFNGQQPQHHHPQMHNTHMHQQVPTEREVHPQTHSIPLSETQVQREILKIFQEMQKIEQNDQGRMQKIREKIKDFSRDNYEHSKFIVEQFVFQYRNIHRYGTHIQLIDMIDIIDIIIKYVQGDYIRHFEEKLNLIFPMIWQKTEGLENAHNKRQFRIKLIKYTKIWSLFFSPAKLESIAASLKLIEHEKELLAQNDYEKIAKWKREFVPRLDVPEYLYKAMRVIGGSNFTQQQLYAMYQNAKADKYKNYPVGQNGRMGQGVPNTNPNMYAQPAPFAQKDVHGINKNTNQPVIEGAPSGTLEDKFSQLVGIIQTDNNRQITSQQNDPNRQQMPIAQGNMPPPGFSPNNIQRTNAPERGIPGQSGTNMNGLSGQNAPASSTFNDFNQINQNLQVNNAYNMQQHNISIPHASHSSSNVNTQSGYNQPTNSEMSQQTTQPNHSNQGNRGGNFGGQPPSKPPNQPTDKLQPYSMAGGSGQTQWGFLSCLFRSFCEYQLTQKQQVERQIYQQFHPDLYRHLYTSNQEFNTQGNNLHSLQNHYSSSFQYTNLQPNQGAGCGGGISNQPLSDGSNNRMMYGMYTRFYNLDAVIKDPRILKAYNIIAVSELHQSIKFQCSNCGMRFVRNEQLKAHLDKHFYENNEIRKRKRVTPCMGHDNRPFFNSFNSWVTGTTAVSNGPSGSKGDPKNQGQTNAIHGYTQQNQNIVPYSSVDNCCFMCKEKLKVMRDQGWSQLNPQNANQNEEANATTDENSYFIDVRKIRVSLRNKMTGNLEKREVTIHMDCIKQLEILKQQRQKVLSNRAEPSDLQNGSLNRNSLNKDQPALGRRANDALNNEQSEDQESVLKRQKLEANKGASWNNLNRLIGGLNDKNDLKQ